MDTQPNTVDAVTSENAIESLQQLKKNIIMRSESIQLLRKDHLELNLKKDRTPEEETKLVNIQIELDEKLKALEDILNLSKGFFEKMKENTYKLIDRNSDENEYQCVTKTCSEKSFWDSTEDFHKVHVINPGNSQTAMPHIMILDSKEDFEEVLTIHHGSSVSDCDSNDESSSCNAIDDNEGKPDEIDILQLKHDVCQLKECLQKIIDENQCLRFKFKALIEQSEAYKKALQLPSPFKILDTGEIIFTGKKEMEEKLMFVKAVVIKLNGEIAELKTNQIKLKSAKDIIDNYKTLVKNCQCGNASSKENIETGIKVKKQKFNYIKTQTKQLCNELNNIKSGYECECENKKNMFCKNYKLTESINALKKEIEELKSNNCEEIMCELNKTNEDMEAFELIIKERTTEMNNCEENLVKVQSETKEITSKTEILETAIKNMPNDFTNDYNNLEEKFQEKFGEMIALPVLIKSTYIKVQEETDLRVLAEETRDKLEREIQETENSNKPFPPYRDPTAELEILEAENDAYSRELESLDQMIATAGADLETETYELEKVNHRVDEAVAEGNRRLNAFRTFSAVHVKRIAGAVRRVRELLADLQGKECARAVVKKTVMEHLNDKIDSIHRDVEECRSQVRNIMEPSEKQC